MVGGGLGFLFLAIFVLLTRPVPATTAPQSATIPPDVTVLVSERVLSQLASNSLQRPATVEFSADGEMRITAPFSIMEYEPVVTVVLSLGMEGTSVVSELQWVKLGSLYIPATLLPEQVQASGAELGKTIQRETPPDFALVGLDTLPNALEIKLKWVGP